MLKWFVRAAVSVTVVWLLLLHIPIGEVLAAVEDNADAAPSCGRFLEYVDEIATVDKVSHNDRL